MGELSLEFEISIDKAILEDDKPAIILKLSSRNPWCFLWQEPAH
jgi:hypothetical protein